MQPILWHLVISHFSEKARWALDYKSVDYTLRAPSPGVHMAVAAWLTRGRQVTLPVLELDGRRVGDSTAIIDALEQRFPEPPLYPAEPELRRRALDLEEWFDEQLAPCVRRVAFYELRRDPERFDAVGSQAAPQLFARLGRGAGVFGRAFTGARYGAMSADMAAEARERLVAAFDRLEAELGEHEYLAGDSFTVADLTAAALLYPVVLPRGCPVEGTEFPAPWERLRARLEGRRGWCWVEQMYERHRSAAASRPVRA